MLALLLAGCDWFRSSAVASPLTQTLESPEAVARAVVDHLKAGDLAGLRSLAITESEFRDVVWAKLPTSRPERNIPWDYAWKDLAAKSDASLRGRLAGWQDRGFTVTAVAFTGGTTDYGTFRVHRNSLLTLRDRDGAVSDGRIFGSIIEQNGRYKVFSYVVD